DPTDAVWKDIFLPEDLNAIINFKKPMLPKLPANFEEYLLSYNGKKDVKSLVARRREVDFDPFEAPELYWAHKAIVEASDLFVYNYLPFQDHSESDLIHQICEFVEKCFDGSSLKVQSGERGSTASRERRNATRGSSTSSTGQLARKCMGTRVDMRFSSNGREYGCTEARLSNDINSTKTIQEGRMKLPRTMKDMFVRLVAEAPSAIHNIKVGGFLISGKCFFYLNDFVLYRFVRDSGG
ncbi:hypothetical protein BDB00DRAFT_777653, partial [Zychaea mexicana]|uniref:uncharacterized protein n=1 Tax=Zychaea mexicana TaxID=64656 RepID=UPI0022FEC0DD